ncbi:MAG: DUF2085 domain-containing protein [Balneolaceae bacterium]
MFARQLQVQNVGLYAVVIISSTFLLFTALGPGIIENSLAHPLSWQYLIFDALCHQDTLRSYHINMNQMAVCSRCFGIYSSFFAGWLLLPALAFIRYPTEKLKKTFLIAAILLNSTDVIANFFNVWTNTLNSRFLLGALLGLAIAFFLAESFFKQIKSEY